MILKLIFVVILLYFLIYNCIIHEAMTCRQLKISDPPLASIYDIIDNKNKVFEKESSSYEAELKNYFKDLKRYCVFK